MERISELSPALLAVAGFDGYLREFNPAFEVFGYSREELLTRPWVEFAHPDDRERMLQAAESLESGVDVMEVVNRIVCRDGSLRWVEWRTRVLPEEGLFYAAGRDLTESHHAAEEQAALRRVATVAAQGAKPADVFHAVAEELGRLLDAGSSGLVRFDAGDTATLVAGWGRLGEAVPDGARLPLGGENVLSRIAATGQAARVDEYERTASGTIAQRARLVDTTSAVGSPVIVAGRVWGAMVASVLAGSTMPADAVRRVEQFAELIATAIANTEAQMQLGRLADEQAALRRVATLVAEEAPAAELFAKVAEEVAGIFGEQIDTAILRFDPDDTATVVAVWGEQPEGGIREGVRLPIEGTGVAARVHRERGVVRVDRYTAAEGSIADHARRHGITSAVGCPILVSGRVWGAMVVAHYLPEPFPADGERRVSQFTELVATAVANAEARAELQRLATEQAALRRVATLVAEAAAPAAVFDAVVTEVAGILEGAMVGMMRAEGPGEVVIVAHRGQKPGVVQVGMRLPLTGDSATARVLRTGRSTRMTASVDGEGAIAELVRRAGSVTTVGTPIVVEGRIWGVITASWPSDEEPPLDAEERLTEFAKLLDSAIANADSRAQLTASRARVLTAGDEARRRVVRDLHDGAQQRLVHSIVTLTLARKALPADVDQAIDLLDEAIDHTRRGNEELRELAQGILPGTLIRGGLAAAIESLVTRSDLPVQVEVLGERLPASIEASAYFIVAEALTNVIKHAGAKRATVIARVDGDVLQVVVRDDGAGGADPDGHGLLGLGDRAAALGGRLWVDSPPGGGTVVTAQLPLTEA